MRLRRLRVQQKRSALFKAAAAEHNVSHLTCRGTEIFWREAVLIEDGSDLDSKIGIGLGIGPDHEKEMPRIDPLHLAGGDPILDHQRFAVHPVAQFALQEIADLRRAMDDLIGEDARGEGALPRQFDQWTQRYLLLLL